MKNLIIKIIFLSFFVFTFFNTAHASLNIDAAVDVPASCTATDTDGIVHNYGGGGIYLAICALEAAENSGAITNTQLSNQYPSLGLFVTAINGVTADPASQYWALYQNNSYANSGLALLPVSTGDTIALNLHDFSDNDLGDDVTLHINSLIPSAPTGSGGGQLNDPAPSSTTNTTTSNASATTVTPPLVITPPAIPTFDVKKASDFLVSQQKDDGSFDNDLYTDWASLALATGDNQTQVLQLVKYLGQSSVQSSNLTDYERHAMALMALGLNPYDTNRENYIAKIVSSFDGKQFGDGSEDNDDVFALIVLQNAGYTQNDSMISTDIDFILSTQNTDGSWDSSVDMTGAAMEALSAFNQTGQVRDALSKAENFLEQNQKDDGSWNDNASSTAWAMEGILAQNEKPADWASSTSRKTPLDYLATIQDTDGGVKDSDLNTKIWETSYVVSALSGKTWNQIMQTFSKENLPAPVVSSPTTTSPNTNTVSIKNTENKIAKIENPATDNTATVLNAIPSPTPTPSTNWFIRFLERIF